MSKFVKGLVKFSVATAAVGGVLYLLKDKIKESSLYTEYDVDTKINKVKDTIKDKMPWSADEEELIEDSEIFLDSVSGASTERDYVSLDSDNNASDDFTEVSTQ